MITATNKGRTGVRKMEQINEQELNPTEQRGSVMMSYCSK